MTSIDFRLRRRSPSDMAPDANSPRVPGSGTGAVRPVESFHTASFASDESGSHSGPVASGLRAKTV
jgi:hypothetical protein